MNEYIEITRINISMKIMFPKDSTFSLENREKQKAVYFEVINNIDNSNEYFEKKSEILKKQYRGLKKTKYSSDFIESFSLFYKDFVKDKSKNTIFALGLIDLKEIEQLKKDLPEAIRETLRRFSKNLTNRDKYVLYKMALETWNFSKDENYTINDLVQFIYYVKKSYQNPREYLDVHSRVYIEDYIQEYLLKIAKKQNVQDHLALLSLDLNGLKTVNDFGVSHSHLDGNKFLLVFTHIMQSGKTTKLLESLGIKVIVAAQSGDEYLVLFESKKQVKNLTDLIEQLYLIELMSIEKISIERKIRRHDGTVTDYLKEFQEIDIAHIIDYQAQETNDLFMSKNIVPDINQKFKLTCSFGWSHISDIFEHIYLEADKDFIRIRKEIQNIFISISDHEAVKNKKIIKECIKESGLLQLYALLTIRSDLHEIITIRQENKRLRTALNKERNTTKRKRNFTVVPNFNLFTNL